jgi:hypothetical protein
MTATVGLESFAVGRPSLPYDLLWPVSNRIKPISDTAVKVVEDAGVSPDALGRKFFSPGAHSRFGSIDVDSDSDRFELRNVEGSARLRSGITGVV